MSACCSDELEGEDDLDDEGEEDEDDEEDVEGEEGEEGEVRVMESWKVVNIDALTAHCFCGITIMGNFITDCHTNKIFRNFLK